MSVPGRGSGSPEDGSSDAVHPEDPDVPDATARAGFARPDLTAFCRLDDLGLEVTGQRLDPDRAVLTCRVIEPDLWCRRCGCEGIPRDSVPREFAHEPLGWRPTTLIVTVGPSSVFSHNRYWPVRVSSQPPNWTRLSIV